jgi:RimJ/RimL family protein N-acetyltransferase
MTNTYFLTTERLGVRCWSLEDMPLALMLWGDPKVTQFIDSRGQFTEDQVRDRLLKEIATQESSGVQYWPLFCLDSHDFAGCCGLRPYRPEECVFELGVHLRSQYWGQGYASEIAAAVLLYAFGPLGAKALFAGHHPNNQASRRFLQKLGFQYTHDQRYPATGLQHPSYLLARKPDSKTS